MRGVHADMSVCVLGVRWWGRGKEEGDALTFNNVLCNSTLEVIITNTMQVVTFDPVLLKKREWRGRGGLLLQQLGPIPIHSPWSYPYSFGVPFTG